MTASTPAPRKEIPWSPPVSLALTLASSSLAFATPPLPPGAAPVASAPALTEEAAAPSLVRVYVGTYTSGDSRGIYRFDLDLDSGSLTPTGAPTEAVNPSFLALHPSGRLLFSVNEIGSRPDDEGGAVSAYAVDPATGALTLINQQPSHGAAPCHISLAGDGRHLLVANYWGGSVAVLPIGRDGALGEATSVVRHSGKGRAPRPEAVPHAHAIHLDETNRFALVADLGLDEIYSYPFDPVRGVLAASSARVLALDPGAGPRHLALHPDGSHVFAINELSSTVSALAFDPERGVTAELQQVATLPRDFAGKNSPAEVLLSPDARFLYGSNRGHDSLVIFAVDESTAPLTLVGHQPSMGRRPRNFGIEPTGRYLVAANQDSDTLVVFEIDPRTGLLDVAGEPVSVPTPVCVRMTLP